MPFDFLEKVRNLVPMRAEGKFTCIMPSAAEIARSERLFARLSYWQVGNTCCSQPALMRPFAASIAY